ncbi:response regulator transcription factor [Rufibacter radiotolerans]|uniref:response regulator transcription factor n=1 Tax=Rufibacter radiotolerans TaxID=1379910 RepID=UPI00069F330A|nr:response regulator [Rufibacter radiotolerans]
MEKILLIEDNEFIRENAAQMLSFAQYEVLTAEDGKKGIASAIKNLPDLIICDIMMPESDGFCVLETLKKLPETSDIPIVFLSAKSTKENKSYGLEMGAADYLTKPFSEQDLLNVVENILHHRHNKV